MYNLESILKPNQTVKAREPNPVEATSEIVTAIADKDTFTSSPRCFLKAK